MRGSTRLRPGRSDLPRPVRKGRLEEGSGPAGGAQSLERLTLGFGSGRGLRVVGRSPASGSCRSRESPWGSLCPQPARVPCPQIRSFEKKGRKSTECAWSRGRHATAQGGLLPEDSRWEGRVCTPIPAAPSKQRHLRQIRHGRPRAHATLCSHVPDPGSLPAASCPVPSVTPSSSPLLPAAHSTPCTGPPPSFRAEY